MGLSYAGVDLIVPTTELCEWIERNISPRDVYEWAYRAWPGFNLTGLAFPEWMRRPSIKLNTLWWPTGASRWAVGHFLCTESQLRDIRPLVVNNSTHTPARTFPVSSISGDPQQATLSIDSDPLTSAGVATGTNFISTDMFLMPPRPLSQFLNVPSLNGHYLLTLVDDRYYWWSCSTGNMTITEGTTAWSDVFTTLQDQLGLSQSPFTIDTVSSDYLKPSRTFGQPYEAVPIILDSAAYNVGMRVVRKLDGSIYIMSAKKSRDVQNANVQGTATSASNLNKQAGGTIGITRPGQPPILSGQ
jgi:hypothetical protein